MDNDEFMKIIGNTKVLFGLRAQGHIETIEKMLADGESWVEIGRVIWWDPATAKEFYEREKNQ